MIGWCRILHSELKPNFEKEMRFQKGYEHRAHIATHSIDNSFLSNVVNFSTNPAALLNDFATYFKKKSDASLTLLGKFVGFLANSIHLSQENLKGILTAFKIVLVASIVHNFLVIDSGASNHITNKVTSLNHFENFLLPKLCFIFIFLYIILSSYIY